MAAGRRRGLAAALLALWLPASPGTSPPVGADDPRLPELRRLIAQQEAGAAPGARPPPVAISIGDDAECILRLVENLLCRLRALGMRPYLFFALNTRMHAHLLALGEPAVLHSANVSGPVGIFGTKNYNLVCTAKLLPALLVTAMGRDVLYVDVDIVPLRDPRPFLAALASRSGAHLAFQRDQPNPTLNAGLYYARATPETAAFLGAWSAAQVAVGSKSDDQSTLNRVVRTLCACSGTGPPPPEAVATWCGQGVGQAVIAHLPEAQFRTAHRLSLGLKGSPGAPPLMVHFAWLVGLPRKHVYMLGLDRGLPGGLRAELGRAWCSANRTRCGGVLGRIAGRRHRQLHPMRTCERRAASALRARAKG